MTLARPPNADDSAREWVLACIDNSPYANSVIDHSSWFASHPEVGVHVFHAREAAPENEGQPSSMLPSEIVDRAVRRLREEGVGPLAWSIGAGRLIDYAASHIAGPIVMGKRGMQRSGSAGPLGENALAMIRLTDRPVCLAPKVFLPIHRALVLLDTDLAHRSALAFVASDFRLAALPLSVAIVARPGQDPAPKLDLAQQLLANCTADLFSIESASMDEAAVVCMEEKGADLLVLSRAALSPRLGERDHPANRRGLWGSRTPVLIT